MGLRRDSLRAVFAALASSGLRFLLFAALARLLPADKVGAFATAQWVSEMAALACSLGTTAVVARYLPELRTDEAQVSVFLKKWRRWGASVTAMAAVAGYLGSRCSLNEASPMVHLAVAAWSAGSMAYALHLSLLTGYMRFDLLLRANTVFGISALGLSSLTILLTGGQHMLYWSMPLAYLIAINFTRTNVITEKHKSGAGKKTTTLRMDPAAVRSYAFNSAIVGLLWALAWSRGELPVLVHYHGAREVALFSAAAVIAGGATQFTMLGVSALGPHLTQLWFADRRQEALDLSHSAMSLQLLLSGTISAILILLNKEVLVTIFGPTYLAAGKTLSILALTIPALSIAAQSHLVQIHTNGRINRNLLMLIVLILYLAAFMLVPAMAGPGAAYARLIAMLTSFICISMICGVSFGRRSVSLTGTIWVSAALGIALFASSLDLSLLIRLPLILALVGLLAFTLTDTKGAPVIWQFLGRQSAGEK